jgi:hypothetical protein
MTAADEHVHHNTPSPGAREALAEALRREGVQPIESVDDWAGDGIFESDDELNDFLHVTHAARRADLT